MKEQELRDLFHAYRPEMRDNDAFMDRLKAQMDAADARRQSSRRWLRMAASFVGVLLVSGIAFAAIHLWTSASSKPSEAKAAAAEATDATPARKQAGGLALNGTDDEPVVFDNETLEKMLADMTAYYGGQVEYRNDTTRQLRFHFAWKREEGLRRAVEKLNRFERLSIRLEGRKIIVE